LPCDIPFPTFPFGDPKRDVNYIIPNDKNISPRHEKKIIIQLGVGSHSIFE
jgi:hypothetical protein